MRFLKRLNDKFSGARSQILLMDPYPLSIEFLGELLNKKDNYLMRQ